MTPSRTEFVTCHNLGGYHGQSNGGDCRGVCGWMVRWQPSPVAGNGRAAVGLGVTRCPASAPVRQIWPAEEGRFWLIVAAKGAKMRQKWMRPWRMGDVEPQAYPG
jgi:hypothetical protein